MPSGRTSSRGVTPGEALALALGLAFVVVLNLTPIYENDFSHGTQTARPRSRPGSRRSSSWRSTSALRCALS